jgi:hypothetical protein
MRGTVITCPSLCLLRCVQIGSPKKISRKSWKRKEIQISTSSLIVSEPSRPNLSHNSNSGDFDTHRLTIFLPNHPLLLGYIPTVSRQTQGTLTTFLCFPRCRSPLVVCRPWISCNMTIQKNLSHF